MRGLSSYPRCLIVWLAADPSVARAALADTVKLVAGLLDVADDVVRSSMGLAGGVGETRQTCGAILGGAQAIGLRYGRVDRAVSRQPAVDRAADLVRGFGNMADPARKAQCARLVGFVAERVAGALVRAHARADVRGPVG